MSKIILKNIGRGKINRTLELEQNFDEENLAEIAYIEVCKHLASSSVELSPDEKKGKGFWKVYVGIGYHVGDVQIVV